MDGSLPMCTVSVIVPNYNHARYLRRRIDTILAQTFQDFELILLDDCSKDASRDILTFYASYPRVRTEFNETNSGTPFKQWNKGVRMARGEYVWIAESDDYADPNFLDRLVRVLDAQPEATFAFCRSWSVGEDDQRYGYADSYLDRLAPDHWKADFVVDGYEECRRFFVLTAPIPNASAVIFRRNAYERVGGADEGLRLCGDYKLWAALACEGKIAYVAEPLNYYRSHADNARAQAGLGALDLAEYFYVMHSILDCVAPPDTLPESISPRDGQNDRPFELSPGDRIRTTKQRLSYIANWNLCKNYGIPVKVMREHFRDWEMAVACNEFAISPPSRFRFFLHRWRFCLYYFSGMNWKLRFVNLMRLLGAPVVGYRHRHWPERQYERAMRTLEPFLHKRGPFRNSGTNE